MLDLHHEFIVDYETYHAEENILFNKMNHFIISSIRGNERQTGTDEVIPSWAGTRALLSSSNVPHMQVAFLPFLPFHVTEISTVFTSMVNFTKVLKQLHQKSLLLFFDEGVFRIVLNGYLKCPNMFKNLIPMLGGFHMAKCAQHCIGKVPKRYWIRRCIS